MQAEQKIVCEVLPDASKVTEKTALSQSDLVGKGDLMLLDGEDPFHEGVNRKLRDSQ